MPFLFTTARGTAISVSKKALEEAQRKLSMMDDESSSCSMSGLATTSSKNDSICRSESPSLMFQTAKGSSVTFSKENAEKLRRAAEGDENAGARVLSSSSASGKTFSIPRRSDETPLVKLRSEEERSTSLPTQSPAKPLLHTISASPTVALDRRPSTMRTPQAMLGEYATPSGRPAFRPPLKSVDAIATSSRSSFAAPRLTSVDSASPSIPASATQQKHAAALQHICVDALLECEVRCALRKHLPSVDSVMNGLYEIPVALCCPLLRQHMGAQENVVTVSPKHFQTALIALGAVPGGVKMEWLETMMKGILWKLLCYELQRASCDSTVTFSPAIVLVQLAYRYNREYVDGHRSILRRISEKDSTPNVPMVLCVSHTFEERVGPHQLMVEVHDGWYFVRANLDLPLSQLLRDGLIRIGHKFIVSASTCCHDAACHPLELLGSTSSLLGLTFNGFAAASPEAPLGALPRHYVHPSSIAKIHTNGGPVPCVCGVVTRVLPTFFTEYLNHGTHHVALPSNGSKARHPNGGAARITRNYLAESKFAESCEAKRSEAYEKLMLTMTSDEAAIVMRDQFFRDVTQVSTIILETTQGEAVAVQRMSRCGYSGGSTEADSESCEGTPQEGQHVRLFNLFPSKANSAPPPLNVKLLYTRGQFVFAPIPDSTTQVKAKEDTFRFTRTVERSLVGLAKRCFGQLVDVVVVSIGVKQLDERRSAFFFCGPDRNVFGALEIVSAPGVRELSLSFPAAGTVCLLQNATFASFDESGQHTIVRLLASEFTTTALRSSNTRIDPMMKMLAAAPQQWKQTVDLGKQVLLDGHGFTLLAVSAPAPSLSASASLDGRPEIDTSTVKPAGPYYLSSHHRSASSQSETSFPPPITNAGVRIIQSSHRDSVASIQRPLFGESPPHGTPSRPTVNYGFHSSRKSEKPDPTAAVTRHMFGNFSSLSPRINVRQSSPSGSTLVGQFSLADGLTCAFSVDGENSDLVPTSSDHFEVQLSLLFRTHLDSEVTLHLNGSQLASLAESISLTPQQLSALATTDEHYHLAAARATSLSRAPGAFKSSNPTDADIWNYFFLHSVVVPEEVISKVLNQLQSDAPQEITVQALRSVAGQLQRWNRKFASTATAASEAAVESLLWWSEKEWASLLQQLSFILDHKLFKVSVDTDTSAVERLVFLKDHCSISDLLLS